MIVAAGLLLCAALIAVAAPPVLARLSLSLPPRAGLAMWLGSLAAVIVFAVLAVVVMVWPGHAPAESVIETAMRCLSALVHTTPHWFTDPAALIAAAAGGAALTRIVTTARRHHKSGQRIRTYHRDVVAMVARTDDSDMPVMWLDHPVPLAYSVDGRPGMVVATEGLAQTLTAAQQRAVLAHEYEHLRGKHHRMIRLCAVMAAALPRVPLFVAAAGAVATLVELAADEAAARETSRVTVETALRAVTETGQSSALPAFGHSSVSLRLHRLASAEQPADTHTTTTIAAILAPLVAAATVTTAGVVVAAAAACALLS